LLARQASALEYDPYAYATPPPSGRSSPFKDAQSSVLASFDEFSPWSSGYGDPSWSASDAEVRAEAFSFCL
jgi:hypothetical protein